MERVRDIPERPAKAGQQYTFEPYVYVAEVTDGAALIAWGGFYFRVSEEGQGAGCEIVDDDDLDQVDPSRTDSLGAGSRPYGSARVEALDATGDVAGSSSTDTHNHVWLRDLSPDTEYRYRVFVDGRPWAEGELRDWSPASGQRKGALERQGRRYDLRFRTHPAAGQSTPRFTFAVIGDYGVGVRRLTEHGVHQRKVARALERALELHDVRFVVTLGDNIYLGHDDPTYGSGEEDDDWFFTFYQPYRYLLARVPFYPSVGNHDAADQENTDDREQLRDNFFIAERFGDDVDVGSSKQKLGLFYSVRFGAELELLAIDTTLAGDDERQRFFTEPKYRRFIESVLRKQDRARWVVPFSHHPPYCGGPEHGNDDAQIEHLLPLFQEHDVRLVLSGHEHNFQLARHEQITCIVSGAGGQLRHDPPRDLARARIQAWAVDSHFLLVEVTPDQLAVTPICDVDAQGKLLALPLQAPDGTPVPTPIVIR
jgi:tartrate-resistant acid phosphatase type 5